MRRVTLPNQFLAEAARALADGETVKIHITGESMYPFIRSGRDTVEIVPCPPGGELPAWCCPFYQWGGNYMIHRYIGRDGDDCLIRIARIPAGYGGRSGGTACARYGGGCCRSSKES